MAVHAKVQVYLDQGSNGRPFGLGDASVAALAFQFSHPYVATMRIEHVGLEGEELIEGERVALVEQRRDAGRFGRIALRRPMAHRAGPRVR
jgi:hypothetical protein